MKVRIPKRPKTKPNQYLAATGWPNLRRAEPSGVYYLFARFGGKLKKKSLRTTTISQAKLLLADELKAQRKAANLRNSDHNGALTFEQAAEQTIRERVVGGWKPRTAVFFRERLTALYHAWPDLPGMQCSRIYPNRCTQWAEDYQKKVKPATYNLTLGVLRTVLDYALNIGLLTANPTGHLKRLKLTPKKPTLPSQEDFQRLLDHLDLLPSHNAKLASKLIRFLAFTGLRLGEAQRVCWEDVDFDKNQLTVKGNPKTGTKNWEIRVVPISPDLRNLLTLEKGKRAVSTLGSPVIQAREARVTLAKACTAIGIEPLTHHDLRDYFATRCIESKIDIPTIAKWLGHKDGGALLLRVYAHVRDEHSQEMSRKLSF